MFAHIVDFYTFRMEKKDLPHREFMEASFQQKYYWLRSTFKLVRF